MVTGARSQVILAVGRGAAGRGKTAAGAELVLKGEQAGWTNRERVNGSRRPAASNGDAEAQGANASGTCSVVLQLAAR